MSDIIDRDVGTTLTCIVHGTFAADANWWRLGNHGNATFADRLEDELARNGMAGTVWTPALKEGFDYSSFAWSGRNKHSDRIKGAKKLSSSLNGLAQRTGASPHTPLNVNLLAHSHGGNVVLEAIRRLNPNVSVKRIVLLGTPLVTVKPAFRLARIVCATVLLSLLFMGMFLVVVESGVLLFTGHFSDYTPMVEGGGQLASEVISGGQVLIVLVPVLLFYGWLFWLVGNWFDVGWRLLCRPLQLVAWLQGKASTLVYGPSSDKLRLMLRHPILLLTSYNDEADLLLQVGSTTQRLYSEYVSAEFSKLGRILEFVFVRPFVLGGILKVIESVLEHFAFGFSLWRTLLFDFEVAPLEQRPYYPRQLLVQRKIDIHPRTSHTRADATMEGISEARQMKPHQGLHLSLREVTDEIKNQIQLRHSTYYENEEVIRCAGEYLTKGALMDVEEKATVTSRRPSDTFWELLLFGNASVALVYASLFGFANPIPGMPFLLALQGYVAPFILLGIGVLCFLSMKRRWPLHLWRWFWVIWAIGALLSFLSYSTLSMFQ